MLKSSWGLVLAARNSGNGYVRVVRAAGWAGSYNRKPPSGEHKCLPRTEMAALIRKLG